MLRRLLALAAMTTGVMAAVHVIDVGKGNHKFTPNQVNADVGDIICESPCHTPSVHTQLTVTSLPLLPPQPLCRSDGPRDAMFPLGDLPR